MKYLLAAFLLVFAFGTNAFGQSKKTIREKGIESVIIEEYFLDDDPDKAVIELIEIYDASGEVIEKKEFNSRGDIKNWEKYSYDEEGNLIEEIFLDEKGRVDRTEKSFYQDGLRIEKHFFDNRGRMYKKKVYVYEFKE